MAFQLKPSSVHGVGVFAAKDIKKGESLDLFGKDDYRFLKESDIKEQNLDIRIVENYSIADDDGYHSPKNFNQISIGWYLNHSDEPNAFFNEEYDYFALKDINVNEEITIDYEKL